MDYEKGKKIEDVVYELRKIVGMYGDPKMEDLEKIYTIVQHNIHELNRVLGKDY